MAENQKLHKISYIEKEITIVPSIDLYEINGINENNVSFLCREPRSVFRLISRGDYRIELIGNKKHIRILNPEILQKEKIQVVTTYDFTPSKYETQFNVDVNLLNQRYNELVDATKKLWMIVAQQGFIGDALNSDLILPELDNNEMWIKVGDHYEGITLTDAELEIKKTIDRYVSEYKSELQIYTNQKIENIELAKNNALSLIANKKSEVENTLEQKHSQYQQSLRNEKTSSIQALEDKEAQLSQSLTAKSQTLFSTLEQDLTNHNVNEKIRVLREIEVSKDNSINEIANMLSRSKEDFSREANEKEVALISELNKKASEFGKREEQSAISNINNYVNTQIPTLVENMVTQSGTPIIHNYIETNRDRFKGERGEKGERGYGITGVENRSENILDIYVEGESEPFQVRIPTLKGDKGERGEKGDKGDKGSGVTSIVALDNNRVQLNYGDNQNIVVNIPTVEGRQGEQGVQGERGVGITSIVQESVGTKPHIKITYNDGQQLKVEVPTVKGDKGDRGEDGRQGIDGRQGVDGIGIREIRDVGDKIRITLTNDNQQELPFPANDIPKVPSVFNRVERGEFVLNTAQVISGSGNGRIMRVTFKKPFANIPFVQMSHNETENRFHYVFNITRTSFDFMTNYFNGNRICNYVAMDIKDGIDDIVSPTVGRDGRGIDRIESSSDDDQVLNRIFLTDGTVTEFTVRHGEVGRDGRNATLTIKRYN